ncbi:WXG100 family type VII secretion target [Phycicoccus avicenniae]|uniref:WXG100 family type VII secretion target n=1 Tax=Phycicoccus avicenniae TaxID=2828860 RepID=UPI003D28745B
MVIPDEGPSNPPLPEDAGPNERKLYDIYGFSSVLVRMTADDWGTTSDTVSNLAVEVRTLMSKLRGAERPWEGPAAESAYATLETLATQLDLRAEEITGIKRGLNKAAEAADTARQAYQTTVRAISTDVDRSGYEKTAPRQGGQPAPDGKVFDQAAYDAAVAAQREQREQQAATVLAAFRGDITTAAKEMPVEPAKESVTITPGGGGGGGGGGNYPTGGGPSGGTYVAPNGGGYVSEWPPKNNPPVLPPVDPPVYYPPEPVIIECGPWPEGPEPTPVDLDGGTLGTTTPTGPGSVDWAGTGNPGGSTGGGLGLGTGGGAIGGGMLAGGAAMLGKGMLGKMTGGALGAAGRGPLVAGSTSAAARGTTGAAGRGGATGGGGRGVVGAGGQGAQARGGRGGAAGVRGAKAGRYGVPKLGESSSRGGKGVVGAGSGAGGRGGRKGKDGKPEGVDSLTHEDEQTWFEGEDDATPPVWR